MKNCKRRDNGAHKNVSCLQATGATGPRDVAGRKRVGVRITVSPEI